MYSALNLQRFSSQEPAMKGMILKLQLSHGVQFNIVIMVT